VKDEFYEANQDLLDSRRIELDLKRKDLAQDRSSESYWMRCPKCGVIMQEVNMSGVLVDRCGGCKGLFLDNGELETLMEVEEVKGFLGKFSRSFNN
jgi:phage FluMu protein Com